MLKKQKNAKNKKMKKFSKRQKNLFKELKLQTELMQEPEQVHNQQKNFEILLTSDQMKKLQKLLPTGYSFVSSQKNQNKKKSQNRSNLFSKKYDSDFNTKQTRRKHILNDTRSDSDINLKRCQKILQTLKQNHNSSPFIYPVIPEELGIPNYFDIIKDPMDIQTVDNKLRNGDYLIESDFINDLNLIWDNATTFNDPSTDVHKMALAMKDECDRLISLSNEKLFQKKEKPSKDYSKSKRITTDKPLNFQEQKNLSNNIKLLPQSFLMGVIEIVQQGQQNQNEDKQLEFNIAALPIKKARELERYVNQKLEEIGHKPKPQIQKPRKIVSPVQQEPIYQQPIMTYQSQPEQMPLIEQQPQIKELKKHIEPDDSSHSSFISDLESDDDQLV